MLTHGHENFSSSSYHSISQPSALLLQYTPCILYWLLLDSPWPPYCQGSRCRPSPSCWPRPGVSTVSSRFHITPQSAKRRGGGLLLFKRVLINWFYFLTNTCSFWYIYMSFHFVLIIWKNNVWVLFLSFSHWQWQTKQTMVAKFNRLRLLMLQCGCLYWCSLK